MGIEQEVGPLQNFAMTQTELWALYDGWNAARQALAYARVQRWLWREVPNTAAWLEIWAAAIDDEQRGGQGP